MKVSLSIVILTKNSDRTLGKVLDSAQFASDIVIYDTGSTDQTLQIAQSYPNVQLHQGPLKGFGPTRNQAALFAKNDWILALDSDEVLSFSLQKELNDISFDKSKIYEIPFQNFYRNRHIRWCGWHPESHIRIYHRKATKFCLSQVHEGIESQKLHIEKLLSPIYHYPYQTTYDFLEKMQKYSDLFALQNRGKKSSLSKAILHAAFAFFKSYIMKRGIFGGKEGFIISIYNANTAFYKYLKLMESDGL